jgi:hypothetical protein
VAGSCKHNSEPVGSIKSGEFLGKLGDCQLLKDSASWTKLLGSSLGRLVRTSLNKSQSCEKRLCNMDF